MDLLHFFLGSPVLIAFVMIAIVASGALFFITRSLKFDAREYARLGDRQLSDNNNDEHGTDDR